MKYKFPSLVYSYYPSTPSPIHPLLHPFPPFFSSFLRESQKWIFRQRFFRKPEFPILRRTILSLPLHIRALGLPIYMSKRAQKSFIFHKKGRITWFQGLTKFSRTLHLKWKTNLIQKSPYVSFMVDNKL